MPKGWKEAQNTSMSLLSEISEPTAHETGKEASKVSKCVIQSSFFSLIGFRSEHVNAWW